MFMYHFVHTVLPSLRSFTLTVVAIMFILSTWQTLSDASTNTSTGMTIQPSSSALITASSTVAKIKITKPFKTININKATHKSLCTLPGVGPKKAAQIIEFRQKHGAFKRIKDLRRVKGFGKKSVAKLKTYIKVNDKVAQRTRS